MADWIPIDAPAARFLFDVIWQSTLWLCGALVLARALERRADRAHRVVLFALVAALATPVLATVVRTSGWGVLPALSLTTAAPEDLPPALARALDLRPESGVPWAMIFAGIWVVGSGYLLARLTISSISGRRLLARATEVRDDATAALAVDAARRFGLRTTPRAVLSDDIACPMVWCWGSEPVVLLPSATSTASLVDSERESLVAVLCHELAHWKRRDHLAALVGELAIALLPWHPGVWSARGRLHDLGEAASDTWVLTSGTPATTYAEALLDLMPTPRHSLALAAVTTRRGLSWRVRRILGTAPVEPDRSSAWSCAVVVVTLILAGSLAAAQRTARSDLDGVLRIRPDTTSAIAGKAPARGQGVIAVPAELDLGAVPAGDAAVGAIRLVNTDGVPHRLVRARTTCGCTTLEGFEPMELAPGAIMQLDVAITATGVPGTEKTKNVIIHLEGQPPVTIPVTVRVR